MRVVGLFLYPVKSAAAMAVDEWSLDARGLLHDREYMVVDESGVFLTQREEPRLALVEPTLGEPLQITTPAGAATVRAEREVTVSVWEHTGPALDGGDEVARLLTSFLGRPCRLVRLAPGHRRPTEVGGGEVGFADGYPLLITSVSSLAELNARMPSPLPMNRFRPNVVVAGGDPFAEDSWGRVRIGEIEVDVVKPCARCAITRVDQSTGVRGDGEPLRTLGTFRKAKGGVMFGQNAVHRTVGGIRVGDPVRVLTPRS